MKKINIKFIFLSILSIFVISCGNPIKPKDYTKEAIDQKYPYWNISLSGFFVTKNTEEPIVLTADEKRYALESLALMRAVVNTPEFDMAITNHNKDYLASSTGEFPGGAYNVKTNGTKYDKQRLLEVIKNAKYTVSYTKAANKTQVASANVGDLSYVFYGYTNFFIGDKINIPNLDWHDVAFNWLANFMALIFHEHLHNLGFNHKEGGNDVPSTIQGMMVGLGDRVAGGDLKEKYSKMYEELKAYYFTEYQNWLTEDTIYDPNTKK